MLPNFINIANRVLLVPILVFGLWACTEQTTQNANAQKSMNNQSDSNDQSDSDPKNVEPDQTELHNTEPEKTPKDQSQPQISNASGAVSKPISESAGNAKDLKRDELYEVPNRFPEKEWLEEKEADSDSQEENDNQANDEPPA